MPHANSHILELVEIVNNDMEAESGFEFPHSLDCTVTIDKAGQPHLSWALVNNMTRDVYGIGEYAGNDADFMRRFLEAHKEAFGAEIEDAVPSVAEAYKRWHNRAMRSVSLPREDTAALLEAQDSYRPQVGGRGYQPRPDVASRRPMAPRAEEYDPHWRQRPTWSPSARSPRPEVGRQDESRDRDLRDRPSEMGRMPLPPFTQQDTTTGKPLKYTDSYKETRWFVFKKGKSHKFWTIRMAGPKQAVTFGRVGQEGQTKIKIYTTPNRQMAASGKLIEKKLAKGYIEIGRRMGIDPKEMSDPKHQAEHSAMPHEEPRHARQLEAEASRHPVTSAKFETRYFELMDGKSKKFWSIKRSTGKRSTRYTVNWGRIGTEGQTKTFTLPTASAMVKSADKLIAQKIAKGYAAVDRR